MKPVWDRLMSYTDRRDEAGACWLWTGYRDPNGYGRLSVGGLPRLAHQLMYIESFGPVPAGLELDHLCGTPACVHPLHLEAVTHAENQRRMRRPVCGKGHVMGPANSYIKPSTEYRECLTCMRERARINSARRRREARSA